MEFAPLDIILHLDTYLEMLIAQYGNWIYLILFAVIFCETGLVVMPFLPGDSLLFIAGGMAAIGGMDLGLLMACLMVAATLGDSTNYVIGRTCGKRLFANPDSKIFRRDYLQQTEMFYLKHGGKTVTLARFLPILRTFAPFVAGLGRMHYPRFLGFSVAGTLLWVGGLTTLGYYFANIPFIRQHLTLLILAVIAISLAPVVIGGIKQRQRSRALRSAVDS
jgi:membrane-associated protein